MSPFCCSSALYTRWPEVVWPASQITRNDETNVIERPLFRRKRRMTHSDTDYSLDRRRWRVTQKSVSRYRMRRRLNGGAQTGKPGDQHGGWRTWASGYRWPMKWGYTCSSEEFEASELVEQAAMAEQTGFDFVTVSDHFHPWTSSQGHSPFAWTTIGGIAARTDEVALGTGVTCPLIRYHPAVIAQAAATAAELSGGRFFLGVGTGEALNEHITADRWPPADVRQEMLVEAVQIIRALDRRNGRLRGRLLRRRERPPVLDAIKAAADLLGRIW